MSKFIFVAFVVVLFCFPIWLLNIGTNSSMLWDFMRNNSIEIMGVILGLNMATASSILGVLTNIEIQADRTLFDLSKNEVKQNLLFLLVTFSLQVLFVVCIPYSFITSTIDKEILAYRISLFFMTFLFALYVYALWEMTNSIFLVQKIKPKDLLE